MKMESHKDIRLIHAERETFLTDGVRLRDYCEDGASGASESYEWHITEQRTDKRPSRDSE